MRVTAAWDLAVWVLATGLGLGYCPVVPATVGALWGIPLAWWMNAALSPGVYIALQAALLAAAVVLADHAERLVGRKDDRRIVVDEIATLPLVLVGLPLRTSPWLLLSGFVLHRLLDVVKPWPARSLQRVTGGVGIVADDLVSSLYALGAHWLLFRVGGGLADLLWRRVTALLFGS